MFVNFRVHHIDQLVLLEVLEQVLIDNILDHRIHVLIDPVDLVVHVVDLVRDLPAESAESCLNSGLDSLYFNFSITNFALMCSMSKSTTSPASTSERSTPLPAIANRAP